MITSELLARNLGLVFQIQEVGGRKDVVFGVMDPYFMDELELFFSPESLNPLP